MTRADFARYWTYAVISLALIVGLWVGVALGVEGHDTRDECVRSGKVWIVLSTDRGEYESDSYTGCVTAETAVTIRKTKPR